MSITITDPILTEAMTNSHGWVDVKDAAGRIIGQFVAGHDGKLPPGVVSPFSDEELKELRRDQRDGRSLKDILRDLEARG